MKILIVEDDLISRRLLDKILSGWGHEVLVTENGQEAWETVLRENPKFVIADWVMPVMDGVELCRKIRAAGIQGYVYFILLTGRGKIEDIVEGLASGADDYVTKPFDREELKVRIRAGERILDLEKKLTEKNEELHYLNHQLEKLAAIDPLMDIGNRRNFYETIEKTHGHSQAYGLIMCDVDRFKTYNDTYGHISGDHILRKIADTIKISLPEADDVFRYGGEEIVIVLPKYGIKETTVVAEQLRRDVEALGLEHSGSESGLLTISCGVAAFCNDNKPDRWEMVLDQADRALYAAKSGGRNRVCEFSEENTH